MIAIDTNVLVRFLVSDDPDQARRARALVEENPVFVSLTVLLEAEWVLRSAYGFAPAMIIAAFRAFAGLPGVIVQEPETLAKALSWRGAGLDFADALHLARMGDSMAFATFDVRLEKAAKRAGVEEVRLL